MYKPLVAVGVALLLAGCASAQVTRTSANTMIINADAEPSCGSSGVAKVAARSAAIETIRAGYDRYTITGSQAFNNVHTYQLPGQYETKGRLDQYGNYYEKTTYKPGATQTTGSYDNTVSVVMFRPGDPGYEYALDARSQLGPEWQKLVRDGVNSCL